MKSWGPASGPAGTVPWAPRTTGPWCRPSAAPLPGPGRWSGILPRRGARCFVQPSSFLFLHQLGELAARIERAELVGAADVPLADKNLWQSAPSAPRQQLFPQFRLILDGALGVGDSAPFEQRLHLQAIAAETTRVDGDRRHGRPSTLDDRDRKSVV